MKKKSDFEIKFYEMSQKNRILNSKFNEQKEIHVNDLQILKEHYEKRIKVLKERITALREKKKAILQKHQSDIHTIIDKYIFIRKNSLID